MTVADSCIREEKDDTVASSVLGWLQHVELTYGEIKDTVVSEELLQDSRETTPCTPFRQSCQPFAYGDEVSPVSTKFSHGAIFDSPEPSPCYNNGPSSWKRHGTYAETDASSVDSDDGTCQQRDSLDVAPAVHPLDAKELSDLHLHESPSDEGNTDVTVTNSPVAGIPTPDSIVSTQSKSALSPICLEPQDAGAPSLVFITSCLQCILANLPCSRTPPACSRCKRHSRGESCLLYRRRTKAEMVSGNIVLNTTPVLLKVESDDEAEWEEKTELAEEVRFGLKLNMCFN